MTARCPTALGEVTCPTPQAFPRICNAFPYTLGRYVGREEDEVREKGHQSFRVTGLPLCCYFPYTPVREMSCQRSGGSEEGSAGIREGERQWEEPDLKQGGCGMLLNYWAWLFVWEVVRREEEKTAQCTEINLYMQWRVFFQVSSSC